MALSLDEQIVDTFIGVPAWKRTVADHFAPAQINSSAPEFTGIMRTTQLDGIHISRVQVPAHTVERRVEHINPNERSRFVLCLQLAGRSLVAQDGREAVLTPGDMTVYDTARPYTLIHEEVVSCIGVVIPEGRVNLSASTIRPLLASRMKADDLFTATTFTAISKFQEGADMLANPTRYRLGQTFASLFETLCMNWLTQQASEHFDPRAGLHQSVLRYIDENLKNPDLDPASIAEAHFVSLRSLQSLAQQHDTTVAGLIRSRRLDRCRADLSNPMLSHISVAEIGAAWGFTHPPHFTTLFRTAFGVTPSAYRRGVTER